MSKDSNERQSGHVARGVRLSPRSAQRIVARVFTGDASQEIGLFLGFLPSDWSEGYRFQLGAYENTCAILSRGDEVLWIGPEQLSPNEFIELTLERTSDRIKVRLNENVLVDIIDTQPFYARSAGVVTYLNEFDTYREPAIFNEIFLQTAPLPEKVSADYLLNTYQLSDENITFDDRNELNMLLFNQAESLVRQLKPNDVRRPRMLLRKELIKHQLSDFSQNLSDLSAYDSALGADAEYYIHQILLNQYNPEKINSLFSSASNNLNSDEIIRFLMGILYRMPPSVKIELYDNIISKSVHHLVKSYIMWRYLALTPNYNKDYANYWRSVFKLAEQEQTSYFSSHANYKKNYFEAWSDAREGNFNDFKDTFERFGIRSF